MSIDAGQQHARDQYYVLGSLNGTTPGIPVDGVVIPLNFEPVYLMHTFAYPNQWPLSNSIGLLDAQGKATCKFSITANSLPTVFAGLRLHHAVAVGRGDKVVFASNPAPLRLTH